MIAEHIEEDGFLPDFSYSLRARMSEASFHEWMRRLDVDPTDDRAHYGDVGSSSIGEQSESTATTKTVSAPSKRCAGDAPRR